MCYVCAQVVKPEIFPPRTLEWGHANFLRASSAHAGGLGHTLLALLGRTMPHSNYQSPAGWSVRVRHMEYEIY